MVEEGSFRLTRTGAPFSHVDGNHEAARAKEVRGFNLYDPEIETLKSATTASFLLQAFVDQSHVTTPDLLFKNLAYGSEADICSWINFAFSDAIAILEAEGFFKKNECSTKLERGLFGCRPDILVVRDKKGACLLAIEVKQPMPIQQQQPQKSLVDKPKVLGHAFDHAMAMDAFGQGTAVVIITSFEESYLCSLNESDFEEENERDITERSDGDEKAKAARSISQTQSPPTFKTPQLFQYEGLAATVSHDYSSSSSSPSKSKSSPNGSLTSKSSDDSKTMDHDSAEVKCLFTKGTNERLLYRSTSYKSHQLVQLACTALKIARTKYEESTQAIYQLSPDTTYDFPKALRVVDNQSALFWGNLVVRLGQTIESQAHSRKDPLCARGATQVTVDGNDDKAYYIIGKLGHGATSNVYQALNSSGKQVALKLYVKNYDGNRLMERDEFDVVAQAATKREAEYLRAFYPFLEEEVKVVKIFSLYCVVMPFFEPILKEKREDQLPKIEDVLTNTFQKQRLKYQWDDIRWSHVGNYEDSKGEQRCILYDLSDLVEGSDSSFVQQHLNHFKSRIPDPEGQKRPLRANVSP